MNNKFEGVVDDEDGIDWRTLFDQNTYKGSNCNYEPIDETENIFSPEPRVINFANDPDKSNSIDNLLSSIKGDDYMSLEEEINQIRKEALNKTTEIYKIGGVKQALSSGNRVKNESTVNVTIDEYEEADYGDAYDNYSPSKLKIGVTHPDQIVESSSLSVVTPPDITYNLSIPQTVITNCQLSSLQLESVVYACQKHEEFLSGGIRAGYLIGDGPGVGKGRIISGIIYENMLRKRTKALWISVSNDLRFDANRDLEDIGCDVYVYPLNKIPYTESISEYFEEYNDVGVLFCTYSSLIGECHSYDSLYKSRMEQIRDWLANDFDGVIIFDECHKAKNLMPSGSSKPTKTALNVVKLQSDLPRARIVYCSATGASEPRNMAYMTRLGLWGLGTPFDTFEGFLSSVEKRGVGAMELVAIDMKQRGVYLARQLSFYGVSFTIKEILLSKSFKEMYNKSVEFWDKAHAYFEKASEIMAYSSKERSFLMAQFYSSHQRFFKSLCIASKVDEVVRIIKDAVRDNKSVVIGLQSTGESKMNELVKDNYMNKIVSTTYGIIKALIERHFPSQNISKRTGSKIKDSTEFELSDDSLDDNINSSAAATNVHGINHLGKRKVESGDLISGKRAKNIDTNPLLLYGIKVNKYDWDEVSVNSTSVNVQNKNIDLCKNMIDELTMMIEELKPLLPSNTLDELIDRLGGPDHVAEMTGRKNRIVSDGSNGYILEPRSSDDCPLEMINVKERDLFMDGEKYIAIISEAASSGISLHSDKRAKNKRQRIHITLELSWSADRVIQQFGRSHRSNQLIPPEYLFVISELAGEKRFACVVAKRLESLGALTHGDRRATETRDLSQFNIDNKYGRYALDKMVDVINGACEEFCELPNYNGDFISDARNIVSLFMRSDSMSRSTGEHKDGDRVKIHKFLNRLLGVKVDLQNAIYQFYTTILDFFIKDAQLSGKYDFGIFDLGLNNEKLIQNSIKKFNFKNGTSTGTCVELFEFNLERGISYVEAVSKLVGYNESSIEGFYFSKQPRGLHRQCILVLSANSSIKRSTKFYTISRPNTGFGNKKELLENITKNYYKVSPADAQHEWSNFYSLTHSNCIHYYYHGACSHIQKNVFCDVGKRVKVIHLLCGAIFGLWNILESIFGNSPIRMARIITKDGSRRIGILIPKPFVSSLCIRLGVNSSDCT